VDRDAINALSNVVLSSAFEVRNALGPGLLESAHEACMCHELAMRDIGFQRQVALGLDYKGMELDVGYRIDILVENVLVMEIKAIEKVLPVHKAQA